MKIKNILIIFFIACFLAILIYNSNHEKKDYLLILGDNNLIELDDYNYIYYLNKRYTNINSNFIYDYKKYTDIMHDIKSNSSIYNKNNKIYLNQEIKKATIIIISANNDEYASRCNKNNRVIKEYNYKKYNELDMLLNAINKISNAKIIIVGNYCSNYNKGISDYVGKLYSYKNYINMNEVYNNYKNNNFEFNIYNEIIKCIE